ncbi:MAG: histidine triad nucleotide-binding protein [Elusimicrobiota bacterium]|nr:histidine triad nucleotide-binding protein [Endomicrobiia bacterium]MDW8166775.1 histidine triad nucleotide-binding protein [Elusimicrobiota bacterium]
MEGCIFCKISSKEVKSEIIYEDEDFLVFKDIKPQAPVHLLLIPKIHIDNINSIMSLDSIKNFNKIFYIIKEVTEKLGVDKDGYRLVVNNGKNAGQEVNHLHFHILAGRAFGWPPG